MCILKGAREVHSCRVEFGREYDRMMAPCTSRVLKSTCLQIRFLAPCEMPSSSNSWAKDLSVGKPGTCHNEVRGDESASAWQTRVRVCHQCPRLAKGFWWGW